MQIKVPDMHIAKRMQIINLGVNQVYRYMPLQAKCSLVSYYIKL